MGDFVQYILPVLIAIIGQIGILALFKSRFDRRLERYKIAESGIHKERIDIYKDLNKKVYELFRSIRVYYHTASLPQGVNSIAEATLNLRDYSTPLYPFLSTGIIEKIEKIFTDFEEIGFDIKRHHDNQANPLPAAPRYQEIVDKYFARDEDLFRTDSSLALLMKQVELEMRRDLGTYEQHTINSLPEQGANINLSYFLIREIIGWAGLFLPIFLIAIAWFHNSSTQYFYQPSISHYYYTVSGFLFIGLITLIGVFLISYRGYEPEEDEKVSDNVITWIGGILILIVAIVPTPFEWIECYRPTPIAHNHAGWGWVHFVSAVGFFIAMSYLSIKKFTKGNKPFTPDKTIRNRVYKVCGWGMLIVLGVSGVLIFGFSLEEAWSHMIFWVEVILLLLFGICWLVKGKGLVRLGIQKEE
ncbi:hypothetical protein [Ekhidna sp.]|uniref:hypothetical protein n=1 Tax=Ekhidna sp. TaxID=2608089 RepID=UPI003B5B493D